MGSKTVFFIIGTSKVPQPPLFLQFFFFSFFNDIFLRWSLRCQIFIMICLKKNSSLPQVQEGYFRWKTPRSKKNLKIFRGWFKKIYIYISSPELTDQYKRICKSAILTFDPNDPKSYILFVPPNLDRWLDG